MSGKHVSTKLVKSHDECGAGDTAFAAFSLGIGAGISIEDSMRIANHAAGVVVSKVGTATCSLMELIESFK